MDIRIDADLWASAMLPTGVLDRWLAADGAVVRNGQAIAQLRIEDARHDLLAAGGGRLRQAAAVNDVIEPGSLVAYIDPIAT